MFSFKALSHANFSKLLYEHTVIVEKIKVSEFTKEIAQFRTLTKLQVAQTVADDSVKHDGCPAIFSEGSLPVGRLCVRKTSLTMNGISCTQPTKRGQRGGTMLCRPIQVVLSGFRRVQCVNTTVDKVRHCNDNCVNLNNMTP